MGDCNSCALWYVRRETHYADGSVIENWRAPENKGECGKLGILTDPDFGCNKWLPGQDGGWTDVKTKPGAPWQHFAMIDCPDCKGDGSGGGHGHRCAGTGKVRLYDDGYIADEQTRVHPKEKALVGRRCAGCDGELQTAWKVCPECGTPTVVAEKPENRKSAALQGPTLDLPAAFAE